MIRTIARTTRSWIQFVLHWETLSGIVLLVAASAALIVANSGGADWYFAVRETKIGPESLHLDLTLQQWASDFLLTIFFLVIGIELRHELTVGSLSRPGAAALPIAAALGGMVIPATIFLAVTANTPATGGWGIPLATDIAFALAVLALVGSRIPTSVRAFLLALAVVDDLGAILVIAIFYTEKIDLVSLLLGVACIALFALLQRGTPRPTWVYVVLAVAAWFFVHESGIHATIAGVAVGLSIRSTTKTPNIESPADTALHFFHPISAYLAIPVFAFFAAGVSLDTTPVNVVVNSPLTWAIMLGLVVGKPLGITIFSWLAARAFRQQLPSEIGWGDIFAVGVVSGIGFTVSLLIAELAFEDSAELANISIVAVLVASIIAAILALLALSVRGRKHATGTRSA